MEGLADFFEGRFVFAAEQGVLGTKAVLEAVEAQGGFAFHGARAGVKLRVAAIGRGLCWCCRLFTFFLTGLSV